MTNEKSAETAYILYITRCHLSSLLTCHLDTFRRHLNTQYCFQQAFQSALRLPSCASDSASADHCARW